MNNTPRVRVACLQKQAFLQGLGDKLKGIILDELPLLREIRRVLSQELGVRNLTLLKKLIEGHKRASKSPSYEAVDWYLKGMSARAQITACVEIHDSKDDPSAYAPGVSAEPMLGGYLLVGSILRILSNPLKPLLAPFGVKRASGPWYEWLPVLLLVFGYILNLRAENARNNFLDALMEDRGRGSKSIDKIRVELNKTFKEYGIKTYDEYPITHNTYNTVSNTEILYPDAEEGYYSLTIQDDLSLLLVIDSNISDFKFPQLESRNVGGLIRELEAQLMAWEQEMPLELRTHQSVRGRA
jgi:hypothetical protein